MGAAASYIDGIPERVDLQTINILMKKHRIEVQIDMVRFNLLKDANETVSRTEALQLIENKLPPIYSANCLVSLKGPS